MGKKNIIGDGAVEFLEFMLKDAAPEVIQRLPESVIVAFAPPIQVGENLFKRVSKALDALFEFLVEEGLEEATPQTPVLTLDLPSECGDGTSKRRVKDNEGSIDELTENELVAIYNKYLAAFTGANTNVKWPAQRAYLEKVGRFQDGR